MSRPRSTPVTTRVGIRTRRWRLCRRRKACNQTPPGFKGPVCPTRNCRWDEKVCRALSALTFHSQEPHKQRHEKEICETPSCGYFGIRRSVLVFPERTLLKVCRKRL